MDICNKKSLNILHIITQPYRLAVSVMFKENDNDYIKNHYLIHDENGKYNKVTKQIMNEVNITNFSIVTKNQLMFFGTAFGLIREKNINVVIMITDNKKHTFFLNNLKNKNIKIYYIHHGMWNDTQLKYINDKQKNILPNFNIIDNIFMTNYEKNKLPNINPIVKNKIIDFNGLVQLDYVRYKKELLITNQKESVSKKKMLFVNNYDQINLWFQKGTSLDKQIINEYIYFISFLNKYCEKNNYQLLIKIKHNGRTVYNELLKNKIIKQLHQEPCITILDKDNIYDYINSDVVLIQGYSTFYIESLTANNNVILCQHTKICDSLKTEQFNLLKCKNTEELEVLLNNIKPLINKTYLENIDTYKSYLNITSENTNKKIIDYIYKNI